MRSRFNVTTDNPSEPEGISEKGVAPKTRFSTPGGVYSAYQEAKRAQSANDDRLADIRRAYDRMPPALTPEEEKQLNGFPNINRGELRAKVDTYVSTWTDHNCGGERIAEVRCKRHGYTASEQQEYSRLCTQFFNEALQQWEFERGASLAPYVLESVVRDTQMGLFGIGPIWFKDSVDWRFTAVPNRCVIVPAGTKIDLGNCPCAWIEHDYIATDLWDLRDKPGWNKKAIIDFLYRKVQPTQANGQLEDRAAWENRISQNLDLGGHEFGSYTLIHAYVQQFSDGREKNGISKYIVAPDKQDEFLYEKEREYESYGHVIIGFCDNAGPEGDWHGVRGFGDLCFDPCHFNDKFFNFIARVVILSSLPFFQGATESDRQKLEQLRIGLLGIVTDLSLQQQSIKGDAKGAMEVMGEMSRTLDRNTRIFPQNDSGPRGEAPTATQVAFDRQDQAQFSGLQIKFYRTVCLDPQLTQQYNRLTVPASKYPESLPGGKAAAEFRRKCKEFGVPEKCYRDVEYVRASRSGGSGNMALDLQKAMTVLGVATPGKGQSNARKEVIASQVGWERAEEFHEDEPAPDDVDVQIGLENGLINLGQMVQAFPNQDHQRHLGTPDPNGSGHLAILAATRMAAMQIQEMGIEGALDDATKLVRIMESVGAHCGLHAQFFESQPKFKESAKLVRGVVDEYNKFAQAFGESIADALKAKQPQAPQMSASDQAKLISAQVDAEIKRQMAALDMQIKQQQQDFKLGHLGERAAAKQMIDEQKHLQQLAADAESITLDQKKKEIEIAQTRAAANLNAANGNGNQQ